MKGKSFIQRREKGKKYVKEYCIKLNSLSLSCLLPAVSCIVYLYKCVLSIRHKMKTQSLFKYGFLGEFTKEKKLDSYFY